jgi:hypothetical protein
MAYCGVGLRDASRYVLWWGFSAADTAQLNKPPAENPFQLVVRAGAALDFVLIA